jgi:uroporphyrinogen decarboxylase
MLPFALNQKVEFKKNFGPELGNLDLNKIFKVDEVDFVKKLYPIYKSINKVSKNNLLKNKDLIGFVGAPWTLLVYMINKHSPKKKLIKDFFKDKFLINKILIILEKFLKIHIEQQIKNGATVIQIFDSWAGLLEEKDLPNYIYIPTLNLVNHIKLLNVPVICFPRGIKNYKTFCQIIKPNAINIDYDIDPVSISQQIEIPIQGGLDPKILLSDKENLKKETLKYLNIFKDHPYIFNLGHGVVPETNPEMVKYLVGLVKDY